MWGEFLLAYTLTSTPAMRTLTVGMAEATAGTGLGVAAHCGRLQRHDHPAHHPVHHPAKVVHERNHRGSLATVKRRVLSLMTSGEHATIWYRHYMVPTARCSGAWLRTKRFGAGEVVSWTLPRPPRLRRAVARPW